MSQKEIKIIYLSNMNIFTEYLNAVRNGSPAKYGNVYDYDDIKKKEKAKEAENPLSDLQRLQEYVEKKLGRDKEIASYMKIAFACRWSDPLKSRKYFATARKILIDRFEKNETSYEENLFLNWFYTIDDMIAFNPVQFEEEISDYEDDKKSLKNVVVGEIDPSDKKTKIYKDARND